MHFSLISCTEPRALKVRICEALDYIGLELVHEASPKYSEARTGIKTMPSGKNSKVMSMYPGSPADMVGIQIGDEISAVNGFVLNGDLDRWLQYCDHEVKVITVQRAGRELKLELPELNRTFFNRYGIKKLTKLSPQQERAFEYWLK